MLVLIPFLLIASVVMVLTGSESLVPWGALVAAGLSIAVGFSCVLAIREPVDYMGVVLVFLTLLAGVVLLVVVSRGMIDFSKLGPPKVAVLLTGILSLLPLVQFWHDASFVPSHLSTTLGATATANAVATSNGPHGVVKVKITNSGDVGALILASELIVCLRTSPHDPQPADDLYSDAACHAEQIYDHLTEIDAHSTWEIQLALDRPATPLVKARLVEATVLLWYAREDRLKVGSEIQHLEQEDDASACSSVYHSNDTLTGFNVLDESRQQGVVDKPRRVVYLSQGEEGDAYYALQAQGEDICDATDYGRPKFSKYMIDDSVGAANLRVNEESWVTER
jgi:hypothetical protein